jgi:hypothetical protein
MPNAGIGRVAQFSILLLLLTACLTGLARNNFEWTDASGNTHNLSDLEEILQKHRQWVESWKKSAIQPDLSVANLSIANLSGATLDDANLSGATLDDANLSGARLGDANLSGAKLEDANLSGADLSDADLSDADLRRANLSRAFLINTDLRGADLRGADLSGARLGDADLGRAVFEPTSLPELRGIAGAENLELLTYNDNPDALVQIRKQFENGGFREQERKITYALKRRETELSCKRCRSRKLFDEDDPRALVSPSETRAIVSSSDSVLANCGSFVLNKVFFDWTCQYGMSPGRPLLAGLLLWFVCSLLYFAFIHTSGHAGLYRIYRQSVAEGAKAGKHVERILPPRRGHRRGPQGLLYLFWHQCLLLRTSMFFSLMSAFNIGFRDINFGRWLRLLTRQEFDIKAFGWARVVAGWQSLAAACPSTV